MIDLLRLWEVRFTAALKVAISVCVVEILVKYWLDVVYKLNDREM